MKTANGQRSMRQWFNGRERQARRDVEKRTRKQRRTGRGGPCLREHKHASDRRVLLSCLPFLHSSRLPSLDACMSRAPSLCVAAGCSARGCQHERVDCDDFAFLYPESLSHNSFSFLSPACVFRSIRACLAFLFLKMSPNLYSRVKFSQSVSPIETSVSATHHLTIRYSFYTLLCL